jgi:single-stranded-DNA-specific exonuclease
MFQKPMWRIQRPPNPEANAQLEGYTPIQQALLLSRDLSTTEDAEFFLRSDHPVFHDPFLMLGMEQAVELIMGRNQKKGELCIYADYDADGITGASLLTRFFLDNNIETGVYFPDRFREGYGLNESAIQRLSDQGVNLLITVDCGIRGVDEIKKAVELGMDVIVTDHHIPGDKLPPASIIINPKQPGDKYPFKSLAGVGVIYKLIQALSLSMKNSAEMESYQDLAAIGTVADMVPLVGENRHLVQQGLKRLNEASCPGIEALINVSGIQPGQITASTIGFGLGPRINASGRLASAMNAFELLIADEHEQAQAFAEKLDRLNKERQKFTNDVIRKVKEQNPSPSEKVILSFDPAYHQGVVGLAASRITDQYYRPAIIGTVGENETRASARSIPGFHITEALEEISDLLKRFGGHESAAGFTLENHNREKFIDRILNVADKYIDEAKLKPSILIDACIGFDSITPELMAFLDDLEPFGSDNPQPLFCASDVKLLACRSVGHDGAHLKMTLERGGKPFDAIAFRKGELAHRLADQLDIAFHIERNNYLGYETLQLRVVDIREINSLEDPTLTQWVEVD